MRPPGLIIWSDVMTGSIPGKPIAMGRPRFARNRMYTPPTSRKFMDEAARIISESTDLKIDQPVRVRMEFVFPRPKTMPKGYKMHVVDWGKTNGRVWKWTKPDIDNLEKMLLDSMVKAGILQDDNLVVETHSGKYYGALGEAPHIQYTISIQRRILH
jgi:Holliday junction resolvase RusA-like endonuclease